VVVDDIDMRMTHILRGADHLSNTPKQVMLYEALDHPLPVFAHVPLILGPDKTRLSKRHGATSVIAYKEEGIVPEAFRNFLSLLGWTPPDSSKEILHDRDLIDLFELSGIQKSNAIFDRGKLDWFNTEYLRATPAEQLMPLIEEEWKKVGLVPFQTSRGAMEATVDLVKARARNLRDFGSLFRAYFSDEYEADPAAMQKFLKEDALRQMLIDLAARYEQDAEFSEASTEKTLRDFAAEKNVKAGGLINGARVALTGQGVAPSLFAVMANLGQERTVIRLKRAKGL
jgi:glutamyl-tRNA synthetase